MTTFTNSIQLVYVLAAACFVIGLHLMNSPATADADIAPSRRRLQPALTLQIIAR